MPLTERQQALLQEMGIRQWPAWPGGEAAAAVPADVPTDALAELPVVAAPVEARAQHPETPVAPPAPRMPPPARAPSPPPAPAQSAMLLPDVDLHPEIARMDWAELEATVSACRACGLCESRTQTVFGAGHRQAQWMLVGEAPGEQEDLRGEPFVGKSGQLLDNMLRAVGLTRGDDGAAAARQVYIANVLKCRPPANRNPQPAEVARCEPYLRRQVALVQPKLILAMGRFAVQSLLQTQEPIGRLRGRVHHYQGVPVVVTYHPAYLLRNPLDKARSWEDLCLAREVWRSARDEAAAGS